MRSVSRVMDVSIMTVMKLLVEVGEACERFHGQTVRGIEARNIECDEVWAFCYAKEGSGPVVGEPEYAGDLWTWVAIDADTRLVLSWTVSPSRDAEAASRLMTDLRSRTTGRVQISTDRLGAYRSAVETAFGAEADHLLLSKKETGGVCTSHIERHNLTTRTFVRRFTRLTNAFSKKVRNHELALALYFVWYNYCKTHLSLGALTTPAMKSGLAEFPMEVGGILGLT